MQGHAGSLNNATDMILNSAILVAVLLSALALMWPRLANATLWRATITPLASIIGSGFLVLGPILSFTYGVYAPLVMAALCLTAYLFGSAVRFNIATLDADRTQNRSRNALEEVLETSASWALAFAYVISVSYYLNLFGAFGVSLTAFSGQFSAKVLTTIMFATILFVGWTRGFSALERMEQISVSIKLAMIGGLLLGLVVYFAGKAGSSELIFISPQISGWEATTLAFGLIVTVQGFETSRYLTGAYDAKTRILSMQVAQWFSTAIYMVYIGLIAFVFEQSSLKLSETAIIDMMAIVAPVLPYLLVIAALSAQFSAAVADTNGSSGLFSELTKNRLKPRQSYGLLVGIGLILTWSANVFEIISYASRAFAFYYFLQAAIAAAGAWRLKRRIACMPAFIGLAILGVLIAVLGNPVE